MKRILLLAIVFIIISCGYVLLQNNATTRPADSDSQTSQQQNQQDQKVGTSQTSFTSSDKRVQLTYPSDWHSTDTTPKKGSGQFGPYMQSWIIQSFPMQQAGQGGIPENSVKIDFEIMQGGGNLPLESLIDCQMKTESCERVGINSELFIKGVTTLNNGMKVIQIATFYDNNVFRATAYIQSGSKQSTNTVTAETILNSISFTSTSQL
jgi:hypothetical protein